MTILCVALYLAAAVGANLFVARFGQPALLVTGFVLIPFDLVTRDILHERWDEHRFFVAKMAGLIVAASLLSYVASDAARRVAVASAVSFLASGTIDAFVYQTLGNYCTSKSVRMNGSNLASALVDSVIFPLLAFDTVTTWLVYVQALGKFAGGVLWTCAWLWILKKQNGRLHV